MSDEAAYRQAMFDKLVQHAGHMVACITYGLSPDNIANVTLACEDCQEVLIDFDNNNG